MALLIQIDTICTTVYTVVVNSLFNVIRADMKILLNCFLKLFLRSVISLINPLVSACASVLKENIIIQTRSKIIIKLDMIFKWAS